ncbi:MAG TPA: FG-GAP-like repeat-containing protein, partial [Cytophagales bacterium]
LTFADQGRAWGLAEKGFSNGAVLADLDNDGDLDVVTNNLDAGPSVFRNHSDRLPGRHFLQVKLTGYFPGGTKIRISHGGQAQLVEHNRYRGFQSTQEDLVHFGLGPDTLVQAVEVRWPDGKYQQFTNVRADQRLTADHQRATERTGGAAAPAAADAPPPLLRDVTAEAGLAFTHQENPFEDFNLEPLLPHRFSRNGPQLAAGDADGDGREDVWVGGPAGIAGKLLLRRPGKFIARELPDPGYEDAGGLLFDADGDKDLDLYVVSGGNEYNPGSAPYQDRLYVNDGKGRFALNPAALPAEYASGSCVKAADFDRDGDLDLFVGGRVVPMQYPLAPQSFVLQNNGAGRFSDVTDSLAPGLGQAGMVTAGLWSDFDGDGWPDLVVAGEFMPVTFYKNEGGRKLTRVAGNLPAGFYFSLAEGDFDGDGDADYLAGNLGLNTRFKVSEKEPLTAYAKDFDRNNRTEIILSYFVDGLECPVAGRDAIAHQYPALKARFNDYGSFAGASFDQVLPPAERRDALVRKATGFASVYLENQGNGRFAARPLPVEAQFSAVQAMGVGDFDRDGHLDALLGGNFYSPDFLTGRYDASVGLLLKGDGRGGFRPLTARQSGVFLPGDVRSLVGLRLDGRPAWIAGANAGPLRVLQPR